jgi:hypothetical protein
VILKFFIILTILFNLNPLAQAQNFAHPANKSGCKAIPPAIRNPILGEKLIYSLEWLGIPVGTLSLEVKDKVLINDQECIHVVGKISLNRLFSKIRNVNYEVDTYIDTDDLFSRRFRKRRWADDQFSDVVIDFHPTKNRAIYQDKVNKTTIPLELSEDTHDLLSNLYYLRLMKLELGKTYDLKILYGTQFWNVQIRVLDIENLEFYQLGNFDTFKVQIDTGLSKVILGKRHLTVFFTLDSRRLPLRFFVHSPIGPLRGQISNLPQ